MAGTPLDGSVVVITGAGSGIGRLMALGAARRGATVELWDLSGPRVEAVRDEVAAAGGRATCHTVDVGDYDAVQAAAAEVLAAHGRVDVLVNNAGVVSGRPLVDTPREAVERTFAVNVLALYWTTKAFLPSMVARGRGHVVTVASAAGLVGVARQTDYSASKHAAVGFDESLRAEMRHLRTGVRTTVFCPFYIDTGMFAGASSRFPWLLPVLAEQKAADTVLDAVESGRARVVLPPLVATLPVMRALPLRVFDALADLLGVSASMDHFTGRGEPPGKPAAAGAGDADGRPAAGDAGASGRLPA